MKMNMYQKFVDFVRYNNAFAIAVVLLFSGFGVTYAASPEVRDSIYSSQQVVVAVDNTAIVAANLDAFNFNLKINAITEDAVNYYVAYSYQTLAIGDSIWQTIPVEKTLTVNKDALAGKDLGLYAAKELGDNMDYELSYLKRVQKIEQAKGASQKMVTTEYSGLVGKLLNPKEDVIEGYNPVIPEPVPETSPAETPNPEPIAVPAVTTAPPAPPAPEPVVTPSSQTEPALAEAAATSTSASEPTATTTPISEPAPEPAATSTSASDITATSTSTTSESIATTSEAVSEQTQ